MVFWTSSFINQIQHTRCNKTQYKHSKKEGQCIGRREEEKKERKTLRKEFS